jgi:hypothetical protein
MCPHHLKSIVDISGTMAGYAAGSKALHTAWPVAWLRGDSDILVRAFEELAKPGMSFEMFRQEVGVDTAYIEWRAETTDNIFEVGSDTFIVGTEK